MFTNKVFKIIEKFEDIKEVIKGKWQKDKTIVDQTLHRKPKIEYTEYH